MFWPSPMQLIANDPKWGEAYFLKAVALLRQRVKKSLRVTPWPVPYNSIRNSLRRIFSRRNFTFRTRLRNRPGMKPRKHFCLSHGNKEAGILIGVSYLANEIDKAIEKFTILSKLFPKDPEIMHYMGLAYLKNKNIDEAKAIFLKDSSN